MAEITNNTNYVEKNDIIEVIQRHIRNFSWRGEEQCVLDVDCGLGEITQEVLFPILPKHATLIGCDVSRQMIDYCNKHRKQERLSFHVINIQYMDLFFDWKKDYFHKIFSFYCIHWMQNCRRSICNMYSLLKNNGDILFMVLTPDNPMYRAFENLKERAIWKRLFSNINWFYNASEPVGFIRRMLNDIGFTDVYCYLKMSSTIYPSWDAYMELIAAVNPYLPGLPEHQISECMMTMRRFLKRDRQISEDVTTGEITVRYSLVVAMAKKVLDK